MLNTAAARPHIISSPNDYKAVVCILLAGGADSFNFLVPTEPTEYAQYVATRGSLALSNTATPPQLLPLNYNNNGRTFSVHAGLSAVQNLFNTGQLSFLTNIGTLIETHCQQDRIQFRYQKSHWVFTVILIKSCSGKHLCLKVRSAVGVAGRMADILQDMNSIPEASMNISMAGKTGGSRAMKPTSFRLAIPLQQPMIGYTNYSSGLSNAGYPQ